MLTWKNNNTFYERHLITPAFAWLPQVQFCRLVWRSSQNTSDHMIVCCKVDTPNWSHLRRATRCMDTPLCIAAPSSLLHFQVCDAGVSPSNRHGLTWQLGTVKCVGEQSHSAVLVGQNCGRAVSRGLQRVYFAGTPDLYMLWDSQF